PPVFFLDENSEQIGLREYFHNRPGKLGLAVIFRRHRADFLFGNLVGKISNGPLIFSESVIHAHLRLGNRNCKAENRKTKFENRKRKLVSCNRSSLIKLAREAGERT